MVKAKKGVLVQADESIIAIIKKIDKEARGLFIIEELDSETCLISQDKQEELQRRVKEHIQKHMPDMEGSDID